MCVYTTGNLQADSASLRFSFYCGLAYYYFMGASNLWGEHLSSLELSWIFR
jgi:hypothetical protein